MTLNDSHASYPVTQQEGPEDNHANLSAQANKTRNVNDSDCLFKSIRILREIEKSWNKNNRDHHNRHLGVQPRIIPYGPNGFLLISQGRNSSTVSPGSLLRLRCLRNHAIKDLSEYAQLKFFHAFFEKIVRKSGCSDWPDAQSQASYKATRQCFENTWNTFRQ